jgi:hypothetical protein
VFLNILDRQKVELVRNIGTSQDIYLQRVRNHDLNFRTANDMYLEQLAHRNGPHMRHCLPNIFLLLCSFLQEIHPCSSKIFVSQSLPLSFKSHCLSSLTSYIAHYTCTACRSVTPYKSGILNWAINSSIISQSTFMYTPSLHLQEGENVRC